MITFNGGVHGDLREMIVQRVFRYIQHRYSFYEYTGHTNPVLITAIEDMLITLEDTEYYLLGDNEYEAIDIGFANSALENFIHTSQAVSLYEDIQPELAKFDKIRKNREKYFSETNADIKIIREYLVNSIEIVRDYMSGYQLHNHLKEELEELLFIFEESITNPDPNIEKFSDLLAYIKYMKEANVNFIDKKNGDTFYPIIVDFFIDYMRISEIINQENSDFKKYTNDYNLFRERINRRENRLVISKSKYFATSFVKKHNKSEIKNYILAFYQRIYPSPSLNTVFRKVFNLKSTNDKYREKDMDAYTNNSKQLDIFIMGIHSKYYL